MNIPKHMARKANSRCGGIGSRAAGAGARTAFVIWTEAKADVEVMINLIAH